MVGKAFPLLQPQGAPATSLTLATSSSSLHPLNVRYKLIPDLLLALITCCCSSWKLWSRQEQWPCQQSCDLRQPPRFQ